MNEALPYRNLSRHLRERFGTTVVKIPVNAGFSCPNRDGTIGRDGCAFCSNVSFSPAVGQADRTVAQQVSDAIARHQKRGSDRKFIAYFQPHTNTHGPLGQLESAYRAALRPGVVGIAVGTRPDCMGPRVVDLLARIAKETTVWVELGMQSAHDETLARLHRGHGMADTEAAAARCAERGLETVAHVILGLPGETPDMERVTARRVGEMGFSGVKIHHLYVARDTRFEADYRAGRLPLLGRSETISRTVDFLERIPPGTVVHRLASDARKDTLIAPVFEGGKAALIRDMVAEFKRRGTRQGSRVKGKGER